MGPARDASSRKLPPGGGGGAISIAMDRGVADPLDARLLDGVRRLRAGEQGAVLIHRFFGSIGCSRSARELKRALLGGPGATATGSIPAAAITWVDWDEIGVGSPRQFGAPRGWERPDATKESGAIDI